MSACVSCGFDPDAVVLRSWSFEIGKEVESLNAHRTNAGSRWAQAAYRKRRDAWLLWMRVARINNQITAASSRRRVTIERRIGYRQREFDADNLIGGCKPLVDAMVREGLLLDDKREHAEIHYTQIKRDGAAGVKITIEELK